MRFLIVDDSEEPLKHLLRFIPTMGHEVIGIARNGQEAVEEYQRLKPDVLVMDVIMPRLNGLEALQFIRESDPRAKVVMVSGLKSCSTAMESVRLGASYFLCKPYQEAHLRQVILRLEKEVRIPANDRSGSAPGSGRSDGQPSGSA